MTFPAPFVCDHPPERWGPAEGYGSWSPGHSESVTWGWRCRCGTWIPNDEAAQERQTASFLLNADPAPPPEPGT